MEIVNVLLGALLLLMGRKMFMFFVAAAGFVAGANLAARFIPIPWWIGIVFGVILAIAAVLLAAFVKNVALVLAGFLMGGYVLGAVGGMVGMGEGLAYVGLFLVGGVAGALVLGLFFNLALIWLSSLAGIFLLQDAIPLTGVVKIIVLVAILFIGVIIQTNLWGGEDDD
ncbi:MAG: hypothetical protein AB1750_03645 [Chloroflexota bacterium]